MKDINNTFKIAVSKCLEVLVSQRGGNFDPSLLKVETPPDPQKGDIAFPMFTFSKLLKTAPDKIAQSVKEEFDEKATELLGQDAHLFSHSAVMGPYFNVFLRPGEVLREAVAPFSGQDLAGVSQSDIQREFGNRSLSGHKIMVEFSGPNTNKPLHLGHLRNDSTGEAISRILFSSGAEVMRVNIINDRGVHIMKSMLAYQKFYSGQTPNDLGIKGDRLAGDCYVKFAEWDKEYEDLPKSEQKHPSPTEQAQAMLVKWEEGDSEIRSLWKKMRDWTLDGIGQTYKKTGISFDKLYYESELYKSGKAYVLEGLKKGVFKKRDDGAVVADLTPAGLDEKVLLRSDGTSIYITQDIGTAVQRHSDWPFDTMIYVVGNEQEYHFKALFTVLKMLGFEWAKNLHHLSYGMVNLPSGKMKSREGTVVDADDLIASLEELSKESIRSRVGDEADGQKGSALTAKQVDNIAEGVALGSLNYFLLSPTPTKDILFDPKESISFTGETGAYLQYMGARACSLLKKAGSVKEDPDWESIEPLRLDAELVRALRALPHAVESASSSLDPSIVAASLYGIAKTFSHWYHDSKVLNAATPGLMAARLELVRWVVLSLRFGFDMLNIPFLEEM